MNRKNETVRSVVLGTVRRQPLLCTALVLAAVLYAVVFGMTDTLVGWFNSENSAQMARFAHNGMRLYLRWRWGTLGCWHFPAGWIPCGKVC